LRRTGQCGMLAAHRTSPDVQGGTMTAQDSRPPRPERVVLSESGSEIIGLVEWRGGNPARAWRAYLLGVGYLPLRYSSPEQATEAIHRARRLNARTLSAKQQAALRHIVENGPLHMSPSAYHAAGVTAQQITALLERGMLRAFRRDGEIYLEATEHGRRVAERDGASAAQSK